MDPQIIGGTMPALAIVLDPEESVVAVSGELSWMTETIELETTTQHVGGGGFFGAVKRVVAGGSLFMTEYTAKGGQGMVAFAAKMPGHIVPLEIAEGRSYMVHQRGLLCATPKVQMELGFQQTLGTGIFGRNGFILQKLTGEGHAWVELGGEMVAYDLAEGQTFRVHPGHVGIFESTVRCEITRIRGIKNMLFGADGLFLVALTGPGRIWLQTLTMPGLAQAIDPYLPRETKESR